VVGYVVMPAQNPMLSGSGIPALRNCAKSGAPTVAMVSDGSEGAYRAMDEGHPAPQCIGLDLKVLPDRRRARFAQLSDVESFS
jgi:hypothetical protein